MRSAQIRLPLFGGVSLQQFPWAEAPTEKQKSVVEAKAQAVLGVRGAFPTSSLADLYDPLSMPTKLVPRLESVMSP